MTAVLFDFQDIETTLPLLPVSVQEETRGFFRSLTTARGVSVSCTIVRSALARSKISCRSSGTLLSAGTVSRKSLYSVNMFAVFTISAVITTSASKSAGRVTMDPSFEITLGSLEDQVTVTSGSALSGSVIAAVTFSGSAVRSVMEMAPAAVSAGSSILSISVSLMPSSSTNPVSLVTPRFASNAIPRR